MTWTRQTSATDAEYVEFRDPETLWDSNTTFWDQVGDRRTRWDYIPPTVWSEQTNDGTTWTEQDNNATTWTAQSNNGTTWTKQ